MLLAVVEAARVAQRDGRVRGERVEGGELGRRVGPPLHPSDGEARGHLSGDEDRHADQGVDAEVRDARHRGRMVDVVVVHDRGPGREDVPEDAVALGAARAHNLLGEPRPRGDLDSRAAAEEDRPIVGVDDRERALRDRTEDGERLGLRGEVARHALEVPGEARCRLGPAALGTESAQRRREDRGQEDDDGDLHDDVSKGRPAADGDPVGLLAHSADRVRDDGEDERLPAEAEDPQRADEQDDHEGDAPGVRGGGDHPQGGGGEVGDEEAPRVGPESESVEGARLAGREIHRGPRGDEDGRDTGSPQDPAGDRQPRRGSCDPGEVRVEEQIPRTATHPVLR